MRASVFAALAALAATSSGMAFADDYQALTGAQEVTHALAGKTFYGRYPNAVEWVEYYGADGSSFYEDQGRTCSGHWTITNGQACFVYAFYKNGAPNCFVLKRSVDQASYLFDSGDPDTSPVATKVVTGDAEGLLRKPVSECR